MAAMVRRLFAVAVIGLVLWQANPASAQYPPEGNFTVTPSVVIAGHNVTIAGDCMVTSNVVVKLDNTATVVASGTVPLPAVPIPGAPPWESPPGHLPAWKITNHISMVGTIPSGTAAGPHVLNVYCNGNLIQALSITVLNAACNTGGALVNNNLGGTQGTPPTTSPVPAVYSFLGVVKSSSTGLPIPNVTVRILRAVDNSFQGTSTRTDTNGQYYLAKPANGSYKLQFSQLGFKTYATPTTYAYAGSPIAVNVSMLPAASAPGVQGTVTDAQTGQLLGGVQVQLFVYPTLYRYVSVQTTMAGTYSLPGVPEGTYQVGFMAPGYQSLWYPNAPTRSGASVITVDSTGMVTMNAKLAGNCVDTDGTSGPNAYITEGIGNPPIPPGSTFENAGPAGAVIIAGGALLLLVSRKRLGLIGDNERRLAVAAHGGDNFNRRMRSSMMRRFGHCYCAQHETDNGRRVYGLPVPYKRLAIIDASVRRAFSRKAWSVTKYSSGTPSQPSE